MDARRWDEWAALFATDAVLDASEDMPFHGHPPKYGVVRGRDRIVAGSRGALDGTRSLHTVTEIAIDVIGTDRVRATWAMTDRIEYDDGRVLVGTGTYHDEYACADGRWLICSTRLARDSLDWS
jgi:3-phenylpropionate/cinnamic acid dioxygenase small subunit